MVREEQSISSVQSFIQSLEIFFGRKSVLCEASEGSLLLIVAGRFIVKADLEGNPDLEIVHKRTREVSEFPDRLSEGVESVWEILEGSGVVDKAELELEM